MAAPIKSARKRSAAQPADDLKSLPVLLRTMLSLLPKLGTIAACARAMNVGYQRLHGMHWRRLHTNTIYTEAYEATLEEATQLLEREALRRASDGVPRLKFHQGKPITVTNPETGEEENYIEREYSDTLLMFLLKSRRPDVYREHFDGRVEHRGQLGVKVSGVLAIDTPATTSTEWEQNNR